MGTETETLTALLAGDQEQAARLIDDLRPFECRARQQAAEQLADRADDTRPLRRLTSTS